ncbi:TetR/AcrR family transcriptional regulator [Streptomyces sp. NPDC000594]|uniref:TetR/AcrR family transcriptional regulator n=1 Tax=Streptomyces sp. NPDC000594 TaxID=3154261 RepID=UPI0033272E96
MTKQDRAVRTRAALVREAAVLFDRDGYDGTSLARVATAAGISLGALTFHFSAKGELADAVVGEGNGLTRAALHRVTARPESALGAVVGLTLELARLLEEETSVRAALRLSRERAADAAWSELWLPEVRRLLERAHADGELRRGVGPGDVATLVEYLTAGTAEGSRGGRGDGAAVDRLERLWRLALAGVGSPGRG